MLIVLHIKMKGKSVCKLNQDLFNILCSIRFTLKGLQGGKEEFKLIEVIYST